MAERKTLILIVVLTTFALDGGTSTERGEKRNTPTQVTGRFTGSECVKYEK